jgi:antitoxin VapB
MTGATQGRDLPLARRSSRIRPLPADQAAEPRQAMTAAEASDTRKEEIGCYSSSGMALNIKDPTADRLARELAAETGESITTAVTAAVRERLERLRGAVPRERRRQALTEIAERSATRRIRDRRDAEEILGYGPDGLPT